MEKKPPVVKAVFDRALEIEAAAERAAYLDEACTEAPEVRQKVEALLKAYEDAGSFLEKPAPDLGATVDSQPGQPVDEDGPGPPDAKSPGRRVPTEGSAGVIGPYKLLQQIGEGGMGTVYMAEQTQPVQRKVALKVIKSGMDSKQVIARFEAERQALALMDHVNIARVFDGGTTGEPSRVSDRVPDDNTRGLTPLGSPGLPYFVMELVHGVPITKYCDDNHLTPRERLELFVPVCQAIQHAHQKGIIHRDIKPSNVMVTLYDGKPVPKVIDFGVAKATEQKLTERTLFTQYGTMVGTLEYMSPEQAEMSALGVDTRSDIYSLGVLLYELLTGSTPLTRQRMKEAAYAEILRMIKEEEPPRPSTRLSDSGEALASISANRQTEPAKLTKLVKGELDWIVMKCLEKDRNRRYETANGFAADVQRYLADEPVQACPPSVGYRFRKFARRHRTALATVTAVAAALVLAVASLVSAVRVLAVSNTQIKNEQKQTHEALGREKAAKEKVLEALAREERVSTFHRFALAERELAANNIGRAEELLHECPENLRGLEWHLLKGLHTGPQVLRGSGPFFDVAVSPDGRHVASAGLGRLMMGELILWDGASGRKIAGLSGHLGPVTCVRFSPDGKRLASFGMLDQSVAIWDIETRKVIRTFRAQGWGSTALLAFSPDGSSLAVASWDQGVRVWDLASGKEKLCYRGHRGIVSCVAYSPDGSRIASWGAENLVRIWDARTGEDLRQMSAETGFVANLAFSPDGKELAAPGLRGLCVWEADTGRTLLSVQGINNGAWRVAFSPDGKRLIAGCLGRTVKIWDLETRRETLVLRGHDDIVWSVALSADGRRLASTGWDGTVRLWYPSPTAEAGQKPRVLRSDTGQVLAMAFSPDQRRLASGGPEGTVHIWDLTTDQVLHTLRGHTQMVAGLAFSADGKRLTSVSVEGTMMLWDADTGQLQRAWPKHLGYVATTGFKVAFAPDGRRLASVPDDKTVKVWDGNTGREEWKITSQKGPPVPLILAYSADGRRLAGAGPGLVKVWDGDTGAEVHGSAGPGHFVTGLAFHPDGRQLATASWDNLVSLWDIASGKGVRELRGHTDKALCVAFSPDGRRLASGGCDNTVLLWDSQSGKKLAMLRGHIGDVMSLAYSGDGKILATASGHRYSGEILLWVTAALEKKQQN